MKNIIQAILTLIAASLLSFPVYAGKGESIALDPATGNYVITHYSGFKKAFEQLVFIPATKIKPTLKSEIKQSHGGEIHYGYTLTSGRDSQQVIVGILFGSVSSVTTGMANIPLGAPPGQIAVDMMKAAKYFDTPAIWKATMAYSDNGAAFMIGWYYNSDTGGLDPGGRVVFGLKSLDLPGIIQAEVAGYAPNNQEIDGESLPDEPGNDPFWKQYFALIHNDFLRRPVAVPTIAVPAPFNATTLLERIQAQMHTWIGMQLLDATFSSQLDRYFAAAADAFRHNQSKAGKEHIQTLRKMLKNEHDDADKDDEKEDGKYEVKSDDKTKRILIDRLAAKVLDFDLKYVLKRMDGNDKD